MKKVIILCSALVFDFLTCSDASAYNATNEAKAIEDKLTTLISLVNGQEEKEARVQHYANEIKKIANDKPQKWMGSSDLVIANDKVEFTKKVVKGAVQVTQPHRGRGKDDAQRILDEIERDINLLKAQSAYRQQGYVPSQSELDDKINNLKHVELKNGSDGQAPAIHYQTLKKTPPTVPPKPTNLSSGTFVNSDASSSSGNQNQTLEKIPPTVPPKPTNLSSGTFVNSDPSSSYVNQTLEKTPPKVPPKPTNLSSGTTEEKIPPAPPPPNQGITSQDDSLNNASAQNDVNQKPKIPQAPTPPSMGWTKKWNKGGTSQDDSLNNANAQNDVNQSKSNNKKSNNIINKGADREALNQRLKEIYDAHHPGDDDSDSDSD